MKRNYLCIIFLLLALTACSHHPSVPGEFVDVKSAAVISPDYTGVTIPVNIAPLNFEVKSDGVDECIAVFNDGKKDYTYGDGTKIDIDKDEWHEMTSNAAGSSISVTVFSHTSKGWAKHPSFAINVVKDSIDPYIAYRLIPPYNTYERITLCYRDMSSFDETEYYNNQMLDAPKGGHCVNCHAFQNYQPDRMQLHVREEFGGTIIYDHGGVMKVNMKTPETISSGVYPSWHPSLDLIAYSANKTFLEDHTNGLSKAEVQDSESQLILYDVRKKRVIAIPHDADMMETFPTWSPDGKWLYYCGAHFVFSEKLSSAASDDVRIERQQEVRTRYKELKYDIYRRSFDAATLALGEPEKVFDAATRALGEPEKVFDAATLAQGEPEKVFDAVSYNQSASMPRISPDGRYLLVSLGHYGNFHIYHPEADLYVKDLQTSRVYPLTQANSPKSSDSFHCWSSNGRWIMFTSRRDDDNYTRLYFTYFDKRGRAHKAFRLPQQDPEYETLNLCSYNVPEFLRQPVRMSPKQLAKAICGLE